MIDIEDLSAEGPQALLSCDLLSETSSRSVEGPEQDVEQRIAMIMMPKSTKAGDRASCSSPESCVMTRLSAIYGELPVEVQESHVYKKWFATTQTWPLPSP